MADNATATGGYKKNVRNEGERERETKKGK